MNATTIAAVQAQLTTDIENALVDAANDVMNNTSTPQEPDFIASLTINFSLELFNILSGHFPGELFRVTGVYCHQKPIVDIGALKDPELADLLLVFIHQNAFGLKTYRSCLYQAKMSPSTGIKVPANDAHQLQLYQGWPDFEYKRAGSLNGQKRYIQPKAITAGAQYLLINDSFANGNLATPGSYHMATATPANTLTQQSDFQCQIIDFLKMTAGRAFFDKTSPACNEWCRMIWDLLDITKGVVTRRRNYLPVDFPRQEVHTIKGFAITSGSENYDGYGLGFFESFPPVDFENENDGTGLSILLIENTEG